MKSKKISEIKVRDVVYGPDGKKATVINVIEKYIPTRMFSISFSVGKVKCSGDHLWFVFVEKEPNLLTTIEIFSLYRNSVIRFGTEDGPTISSMKEIKPEPVCCIDIDSEDKLFKLDLENGEILTHNCQFRAACGRLGSIASMMLFGNTMATTIDGSHPGAGMISANGSISSIQYYYEGIEWIQSFYKKCGYDETGHRGTVKKPSNITQPAPTEDIPSEDMEDFTIDVGDIADSEEDVSEDKNAEEKPKTEEKSEEEEYLEDLDNIFDFKHDIAKIEIEGISGEVDKTKRQKFE